MPAKLFFLTIGIVAAALADGLASDTNSVSFNINVPGNANVWLAGAAEGTIAGAHYDVAPNQSPMELTGISSNGTAVFTFSVRGGVTHDPAMTLCGADGNADYIWSRTPGPENGIGDIISPVDAMIGVFLDDSNPCDMSVPAPLDFRDASARDFASLSPELRQPFFIGDGRTSAGQAQEIASPPGATRLYFGTMDNYGWFNNQGSFTVKVEMARRERAGESPTK